MAKGTATKAQPAPPLLLSGARPSVAAARARPSPTATAIAPRRAAPVASPTSAEPTRSQLVAPGKATIWSYPGLPQRELYLIAADAYVSPRTVVRYLHGWRTQSGTRDAIEAALRKHGREHMIIIIIIAGRK